MAVSGIADFVSSCAPAIDLVQPSDDVLDLGVEEQALDSAPVACEPAGITAEDASEPIRAAQRRFGDRPVPSSRGDVVRWSSAKAESALLGAGALAFESQGCYERNEQTGEGELSSLNWIALGVGVPLALLAAGIAGLRLRNHRADQRAKAAYQARKEQIARELVQWPQLDSAAQVNVVRGWLGKFRTHRSEVWDAMRKIAEAPNTDHDAVVKELMDGYTHANAGSFSTCMHLFLSQLSDGMKWNFATWLTLIPPREGVHLLVRILNLMTPEQQDSWLDKRKSPMLLSNIRRYLPELHKRFQERIWSKGICDLDASAAAMVPEVLKWAANTPHCGRLGGPERFERAFKERVDEEVGTIEKIRGESAGDTEAVVERDQLLEDHLGLLADLMEHWPHDQNYIHLGINLVAAARPVLMIAVQPHTHVVAVNKEDGGVISSRVHNGAVDLMALIVRHMREEERREFVATESALLARLPQNERLEILGGAR